MSSQQQLFRYNRARLQDSVGHQPAMLDFEQRWIHGWLAQQEPQPVPRSLDELRRALATLIRSEQASPSAGADYVAGEISLQQFRTLVQEFAVDGLTEAQSFYYVLPRLAFEAQMPMLRIMIDEFGAGNPKRAHTTLYIALLRELSMPTELEHYIDCVEPDCLAFVNLFFWLTLRAEDPSYFAGAITYLETAIPGFFQCYVQACTRLGIQAHAYYSEHQHIDLFHAAEGQRLLRAMNDSRTLDPVHAWRGALLASAVTARAFDTAVAKAQRDSATPEPQKEPRRHVGR